MARGFGSTLGAGTTDRIASALSAKPTQRSYHLWTNRNGEGGAGVGRMWEAAGSFDAFLNNNNVSGYGLVYQFGRSWSGAEAIWTISRPSASQWVSIGVSYDGGSTTNDPIIYVDGSSVTVTERVAPSGSLNTTTGAYSLGNRASDGARVWDGMLAEFAVWDVILTAAEFASLAKGMSALSVRPGSLEEYLPMVRSAGSMVLGVSTLTGTAVQPHPRIIRTRPRRFWQIAAAPASSFRPRSLLLTGVGA